MYEIEYPLARKLETIWLTLCIKWLCLVSAVKILDLSVKCTLWWCCSIIRYINWIIDYFSNWLIDYNGLIFAAMMSRTYKILTSGINGVTNRRLVPVRHFQPFSTSQSRMHRPCTVRRPCHQRGLTKGVEERSRRCSRTQLNLPVAASAAGGCLCPEMRTSARWGSWLSVETVSVAVCVAARRPQRCSRRPTASLTVTSWSTGTERSGTMCPSCRRSTIRHPQRRRPWPSTATRQ